MHTRITIELFLILRPSDDGRDGHHGKKKEARRAEEKTTQNNKPHILLFVLLRLFSLRGVCVQQCVFYSFLHLLCAAVFDSVSQFFLHMCVWQARL